MSRMAGPFDFLYLLNIAEKIQENKY